MSLRVALLISVAVILTIAWQPMATGVADDSIKINQIQVIATHNSYHLKTDKAVFRFLKFLYQAGALPGDLNPDGIDYTKDSLSVQLDKYGVRGLELDVWNDPEGGHYYHRQGKRYVWKCASSKVSALKEPGFKILHIPDFDFNTTNYTFKSALAEIKAWSDKHPEHVPLFINVEVETSAPGDIIGVLPKLKRAIAFDSLAAENLDREVRFVFGDNLDKVITPDKVRGNYDTLEKAVLSGNWPGLAQARGKVVFIIDAGGNSGAVYKAGHPSLKGRAMFVYSNPGTPEAAFVILNSPKPDMAAIKKCVHLGYIVRTRSDDGTEQARYGDYSDMEAAFASGAQIISTDYYKPDYRAGKKGWTDYHAVFPNGGMVRIDSVAAPEMRNIPVMP